MMIFISSLVVNYLLINVVSRSHFSALSPTIKNGERISHIHSILGYKNPSVLKHLNYIVKEEPNRTVFYVMDWYRLLPLIL